MKKTFAIISAVAVTAGTAVFASHCHPEHAQPKSSAPPPGHQAFGHYLLIQAALAGDSLKGVPKAAATIAKTARDNKLPAAISEAAEKVRQAADIQTARAAFKELSDALIAHRQTDQALAGQFYVVHCPMAFDNQGANWLQATQTVSNPYFGASMLRCGAVKN